MEEVEKLRRTLIGVERRNEILFLPTKVQKPEDGEQSISDWIEAVKSATKRHGRRRRKEDQLLVKETMKFRA